MFLHYNPLRFAVYLTCMYSVFCFCKILMLHVSFIYFFPLFTNASVTPIPTFAGDKGFSVKLDNIVSPDENCDCEVLVFRATTYHVMVRHLSSISGPAHYSVRVSGQNLPADAFRHDSVPVEDRLKNIYNITDIKMIRDRLLPFERLIGVEDLIRIESKNTGAITEILAEVVPRGRYHSVVNSDEPNQNISAEFSDTTDIAYHVPTRAELLNIYEDALANETKEDMDAGEEEGTVVFICPKSFTTIVKAHPDIYGPLWRKNDIVSVFKEMRLKVERNVLSKYEDIFCGEKEASNEDFVLIATECFSVFAEFTFRVSMQRRHHHNRLKRARSSHSLRRQSMMEISEKVRKVSSEKDKHPESSFTSHLKEENKKTTKRKSHPKKGTTLKELKERRTSIGYVDKIIATVVTLIYLLYPTLCASAFSILACQPVGNEKTYLQQDLEIECYADEHMYWVSFLGAPAVILLAFGIPALTFGLLKLHRKDLHSRKTRFRFSIIMIGYTDEAYYWECVVAMRKLSVAAIGVFMLQHDIALQSLTAELVVVAMLVLHIAKHPYIEVTPQHDTLHNAETAALTVSFITLGCGMEMHEKLDDPNIHRLVMIFCTLIVILCNAVFIGVSVFWWLMLKKMDLENLLEHSAKQKQVTSRLVMCLQLFLPDWEGTGREAEINRARAEEDTDMKELDLEMLFRVKNIAMNMVKAFRERKRVRLAGSGVFDKTRLREEHEDALKVVKNIFDREEDEVKKLRIIVEERSELAHERLERRKRKRKSTLNQSAAHSLKSRITKVAPTITMVEKKSTKPSAKDAEMAKVAADQAAVSSQDHQLVRLCFPKSVKLIDFGFKLRQRRETASGTQNSVEKSLLQGFYGVASEAYAVEQGKNASRRGLRNGALLVKIGGLPATQENVELILSQCGKKSMDFLFTESRIDEHLGDI